MTKNESAEVAIYGKSKAQLISSHLGLAEKLAGIKKRKSPKNIYYEDLLAAAYRGLVEAANKYQEGEFCRYAKRRIWGSMQDYLRELHWGSKCNFLSMERLESDFIDKKIVSRESDFLDGLPDTDKDLFLWYFQENRTFDEIADKLGISKSAVFRRVKKSIEKIRKLNYDI